MIVVHPATAAAMTALMPTEPVPNTAMLLLAWCRNEFSTPPAPVWILHPSAPRSSNGTVGSTFTTLPRPLSVRRARGWSACLARSAR